MDVVALPPICRRRSRSSVLIHSPLSIAAVGAPAGRLALPISAFIAPDLPATGRPVTPGTVPMVASSPPTSSTCLDRKGHRHRALAGAAAWAGSS